jgi:hypothetical protein
MIPNRLTTILLGNQTPIYSNCLIQQSKILKNWEINQIIDYHEDLLKDLPISFEKLLNFRDYLLTLNKPLPYVSDLYKLCALYKFGGWVADADLYFIEDIPDDIKDKDIALFNYPVNTNYFAEMTTECLMGATKNHPVTLEAIENFINSCDIGGYISPNLEKIVKKNNIVKLNNLYIFNHMRNDPVSYVLHNQQFAVHCWGHRDYNFSNFTKL